MRRHCSTRSALLAASLTLATALVVAACGGSSAEPPPDGNGSGPASGPASGSPSESATARPLLGPVGLAEAPDGTVWAAYAGSDAIAPLDGSGSPGEPIPVGDTPLRMLQLNGSFWVTTIGDGGLTQVDPSSGTVVRTVDLGGEPEGLAALDGHLFVVLQADGALVEVDPSDGSVVRRFDVGGEPRLVTAGANALFVGDFAGGRIVRVAPGRRTEPVRSKAVCGGVQDLTISGPNLWAACMTDGTVVALDPYTLALRKRYPVDGDPDGLTSGAGATLLVSLQDGPGLAVMDTADGATERVFTGSSGRLYDQANNDVLERDGTAFVSDFTGNTVEIVGLDPS